MSTKVTAIASGVAIAIVFTVIYPALKDAGLGALWTMLIGGVLGGAFWLTFT